MFFSKKVGCYGCHRAGGKGGQVGPDLSLVGRFRTNRDLLESIVFPSAAIVPEYRAYAVTTSDGRLSTGMIVRRLRRPSTCGQPSSLKSASPGNTSRR